ncbi:cytochrome P450 [Archangium lipolyticum]|uniref:cytochrome P450 n=1 Tax=Archangium lipolyticum TaxID=2970465 RepID=UPI00214A1221|nr:cytochrome P450 [Archangium lipolyticum]
MTLAASASSPRHYNLFDPGMFDNPFRLYNEMREADPVYWCEPLQGWMISRYADCVTALRDGARFSAARMAHLVAAQAPDVRPDDMPFSFRLNTLGIIFQDGAAHVRLRSHANRAFTPRALEAYHSLVRDTVDQLVAEALARGSMDYQKDFAEPLPAIVIARMFGVPVQDRHRFKQWTEDLTLFFSQGVSDRAGAQRAEAGARDFGAYLQDLIDKRRSEPGEDMLSYLIGGESEGRITAEELVVQAVMLIAAGHLTTLDMLGTSMLALLEHPAELRRIQESPELLTNAIEELLRFQSPVQIMHRLLTEDVEMGGQRMRKGQLVYINFAAANRDPRVFSEPDRLDVGRANAKQHLAFGGGAHYCVGANLSRMEAERAFGELFRRMPGLRVAAEPVWRRHGLVYRGLASLPVTW